MTTTAAPAAAPAYTAAVTERPRWPRLPMDDLQRQAAHSPEGPQFILGGPGTGKTHTLQARALAILDGGAVPYTVAILTFSAKAADAIRKNLHELPGIPDSVAEVFVGTLHSYASYFLRQAGALALRRSPHYTIWDQTQSLETLADLLSSDEEGPQATRKELTDILHWHSLNRNRPIGDPLPPSESRWRDIVRLYESEKLLQETFDFDDLITAATAALADNPQLKVNWARIRSRHILIDEFQDITPAQYRLIQLMTGPTRSITVATDPNQAIYSWRGADSSIATQFLMDYPEAQQHILTVNHRATGAIAAIATHLNSAGVMTGLNPDYQRSIRPAGAAAQVMLHRGLNSDLDAQLMEILEYLQKSQGYDWDDIAFLYRRHRSHARLATQLSARHIPFTIQGAGKDMRDPDTVAVFAILSLLANPKDLRAFRNAAVTQHGRAQRGFNRNTAKEIAEISRAQGVDLIAAADMARAAVNQATRIYQDLTYISNAYHALDLAASAPDAAIPDICRLAHDTLYRLRYMRPPPAMPTPQLARLFTLAETLPDYGATQIRQVLGKFLERVTDAHHPDYRDIDNDDPFAHKKGITLSTIHASKGQQWRAVFVTDCTDDVMPGMMDANDTRRLNEEERLFYVAASRATDLIYFAAASDAEDSNGKEPSRFLEALPADAKRNYI